MQNITVINQATCNIYNQFRESNLYNTLSFKSPFISSWLLITLGNEDKFLNPLHQDIYEYDSTSFLKLSIFSSNSFIFFIL